MIVAQYFKSEEFGDWAEKMSPRLITMLDILRYRLAAPIVISSNPYSLGRKLGPISLSEHNVDKWGEVLAADVFVSGVYFKHQAQRVVIEATSIGFTGIGLYSDTINNYGEPQPMFHLGVRPTKDMGQPATWGRCDRIYVSQATALLSLPDGPKRV